jgi:hypothetical protein
MLTGSGCNTVFIRFEGAGNDLLIQSDWRFFDKPFDIGTDLSPEVLSCSSDDGGVGRNVKGPAVFTAAFGNGSCRC